MSSLAGRRARVARWVSASTWSPDWTPHGLRQPYMGLAAGALVVTAAAALTSGIEQVVAGYNYHGVLGFLAVLCVALTWGTAPAGLAAVLDAALLAFVFVPAGKTTLTAQALG